MILTIRKTNDEELTKWLDDNYPTIWSRTSSYWDRKSKHDYMRFNYVNIKFGRVLSTSEIVYLRMFWEIVVIRDGWEGEVLWEQD